MRSIEIPKQSSFERKNAVGENPARNGRLLRQSAARNDMCILL